VKAIVVTDEAAGTAGMTLVERPEPEPAINDVVVQVYASGFTSGELTWPSTWTDRLGRDRTPSIPGHELAAGGETQNNVGKFSITASAELYTP
jgi:D-arabinose 1-dehydrogenase-like Zn-dependent alcohol dehydrogenase